MGRILRRHGVHYLREFVPMTGEVIRASKSTAVRYEREPRELVHMDVNKLGKTPDGGGWRAHGRGPGDKRDRKKGSGYDYVHSLVYDHLPARLLRGPGRRERRHCADFLARAAGCFAAQGITRIERLMTDNAWAYRYSLRQVCADLAIRQVFIKAHCPWQNGNVERFNRTLQAEWAYRQVFTSNAERGAALSPWLEVYNTGRRHSALGGYPEEV